MTQSKTAMMFAFFLSTYFVPLTARADADISVSVDPGKLVIWTAPKAEFDGEKVHVWWNTSWFFRVAGHKVAEGKTEFFDVTIDSDTLEGSSRVGNNKANAELEWEAQRHGRKLHFVIRGKVEISGKSAKKTLYEEDIKIVDD